MRIDGRQNNELRKVEIIPHYLNSNKHSCLISFGNTKVICTATIENKVPTFLRGSGQGWITAEYSLLPGSTSVRTDREAVKGRQSGRTQEIQRLIGRSLRSCVDLCLIDGWQVKIDCDVIDADGGTRTASICGGCTVLGLALQEMAVDIAQAMTPVAAVSCGVLNNGPVVLDLNYQEDSSALVDANFVFNKNGSIVEIQAAAENGGELKDQQLLQMLEYARDGVNQVFEKQVSILKL